MRHLLVCLPICLLMASDTIPPLRLQERTALQEVQDRGDALPDEASMVRLAKNDPVAFLEWCLIRYDREVKGYRVRLQKHERIEGKLNPTEDIKVDFQENPFSVLFTYDAEPRPARRVLYVKPEDEKDKGKLIAQLVGLAGLIPLEVSPDSKDARETSRYPMYEFGIKVGMQRTLKAWLDARKAGALYVSFLGEEKLANLDGRACWVLKRAPYREPEDDGVTELTMYVDKQTWLQTGSILKDRKGNLIGEYWFRGVDVNPTFEPDTFTRASLKKK